MISSGNQNQFPSSFAPLRVLFKALMFLSNLNGLNSSPSPPNQGFAKRKGSSKAWKEKRLQVILSLVLLYFVFHIKKIEKSEKYKNSVCMCTLVLVYLGWPLKQNFLNFVFYSLDEHLYAQLSK